MICAFEVKENEPALETSEKGGDVEVIEEVSEKTTEAEKEDKKKDNEDEPTEVEPMDDHDYSAFDDSEVAEEVVEHKVEFIEHPIESSKNEPVAIETPKKEVSENVAKKRDEFQACLSDSVTKKSDPTPTTADEDDNCGIRREYIDKDSTTCNICDKKFSNRKGMTDHLRRVHNIYSANATDKLRMATTCTTDETGQKNFECSICDATFPARYRMYRHLRDDHGESVSLKYFFNLVPNLIFYVSFFKMLFTTDPIPPSGLPANCPECNKEFRNRKNMTEHLRSVHGIYVNGPQPQIPPTPTNCPVCDREYPSEKRMRAHLRQVHMLYHGCTDEEIELVKEEYKKIQDYQKIHGSTPTTTTTIRTRASDQPTTCPVCDKEFTTPTNMKDHRRKIHNVYASASEEEIKSAKEEWTILSQQQQKNAPTPQNRAPTFNHHQGGSRTPQKRSWDATFGNFTCHVCDMSFTLHAKLRLHLKNIHEIQMGESGHANKPLRESQQVFSCNFCHKKFALSKLLNNHIRDVHSDEATESSFESPRTPMGTQQIIIIHSTKDFDSSATQLFQCEHCSATFRNQVEYNKHVKDQHTYVKCDFCYLTFESKWEKKKHMLIAHTRQRYQVEDDDKQCHVCQKNFQSHVTLKRHLRNIHKVEFL